MPSQKIIVYTDSGSVNHAVKSISFSGGATYTTDWTEAELFNEDQVDSVIAQISAIDSAFSGGNPSSKPPAPF